MSQPLDIAEQLRLVVAALAEASIDHALVGGLALAVHGAPRATADIDLLVQPRDIERVLAVVQPLGFDLVGAPVSFSDGVELQRVSKTEGGALLTLDLLLVSENLERAWASRQALSSELGELSVISREALIEMKVAAGRPQDVADVERLRELDR